MFDRIQDAVKVARRFELGPAIAEVRIPAGRSDIAVHKTRGPHHCSVVGDAAELRALVVQVHPLDSIA